MSRRMTAKNWTTEQNMALHGIANNGKQYANRQELLDELEANIPSISPSKALYHAMVHEGIKFNIAATRLTDDALDVAETMLADGYDSTSTRKQIDLQFGIKLSEAYYNRLRYTNRRGTYNVVIDPDDPTRFTMEQRVITRKQLSNTDNITRLQAKDRMKDLVVTRPKAIRVDTTATADMYLTDRRILSKIKDINATTTALGLDFGTIIGQVSNDDLSKYTAQKILRDIFASNGLDVQAMSVFSHPVQPTNEA